MTGCVEPLIRDAGVKYAYPQFEHYGICIKTSWSACTYMRVLMLCRYISL